MQAPKRPRRESPTTEPESITAAPRSAIRPHGPGEDTAFMEEILRELSAQNEQAQANGALRRGFREAPLTARREPSAATIHVERDGAFRTPEGTPSAKAYLPAKTLAPTPSAPIEIATVRVADPRRLPTVRVPRKREHGGRESPSPDEGVPTLRSGGPAEISPKAPPHRSHVTWWIVGLCALALAAVIAVALARGLS